VKKKPFVISYLRALMKLRINATIDKTEVTIIAIRDIEFNLL